MGPRTWGLHNLAERLACGTIIIHLPSLLAFGARSNIKRATALVDLQFNESPHNIDPLPMVS